MKKIQRKNLNKGLRRKRSRAKISGTASVPRLAIFRSNRYMYAQLIDDASHKTLVSASTFAMKDKKMNKTAAAKVLGANVSEAAKKLGIKQAVFHKGSYKYHGRVAAVALGAREGGLKI